MPAMQKASATLGGRVSAAAIGLVTGKVLGVAGNILLLPLFLSHWSQAYYGEWLALSSIATYLTIFDFGLNNAATNRLTQEYAAGRMDNFTRYQNTAMAFYLGSALIGSLILAFVVFCLPLTHWLGIRAAGQRDASWACYLVGLQVAISLPLGVLTNAYRTAGNLALSIWISNVSGAGNILAVIGALVLGGSMRSVAMAQTSVSVLVGALLYANYRRNAPELAPGIGRAEISLLRELAGPSLLFFLLFFESAMTLQGSMILVVSQLGGAMAAVYGTVRAMAGMVRQIVTVFYSSLQTEITILSARGQSVQLQTLHRLIVMASAWVAGGMSLAMGFEGMDIIAVWTNGKLRPDPLLVRLFFVQVFLQAPWLASSVFPAATNRHRTMTIAQLIAAAIGLLTAGLLLRRLGVIAMPIGLMVGESLACQHFIIRSTCSQIGEPYGAFARRLWLSMATIGMIGIPLGWLVHHAATGPALLRWIEVGLVTLFASGAVVWLVGLRPEERAIVSSRLRRVGSRAALAAS